MYPYYFVCKSLVYLILRGSFPFWNYWSWLITNFMTATPFLVPQISDSPYITFVAQIPYHKRLEQRPLDRRRS